MAARNQDEPDITLPVFSGTPNQPAQQKRRNTKCVEDPRGLSGDALNDRRQGDIRFVKPALGSAKPDLALTIPQEQDPPAEPLTHAGELPTRTAPPAPPVFRPPATNQDEEMGISYGLPPKAESEASSGMSAAHPTSAVLPAASAHLPTNRLAAIIDSGRGLCQCTTLIRRKAASAPSPGEITELDTADIQVDQARPIDIKSPRPANPGACAAFDGRTAATRANSNCRLPCFDWFLRMTTTSQEHTVDTSPSDQQTNNAFTSCVEGPRLSIIRGLLAWGTFWASIILAFLVVQALHAVYWKWYVVGMLLLMLHFFVSAAVAISRRHWVACLREPEELQPKQQHGAATRTSSDSTPPTSTPIQRRWWWLRLRQLMAPQSVQGGGPVTDGAPRGGIQLHIARNCLIMIMNLVEVLLVGFLVPAFDMSAFMQSMRWRMQETISGKLEFSGTRARPGSGSGVSRQQDEVAHLQTMSTPECAANDIEALKQYDADRFAVAGLVHGLLQGVFLFYVNACLHWFSFAQFDNKQKPSQPALWAAITMCLLSVVAALPAVVKIFPGAMEFLALTARGNLLLNLIDVSFYVLDVGLDIVTAVGLATGSGQPKDLKGFHLVLIFILIQYPLGAILIASPQWRRVLWQKCQQSSKAPLEEAADPKQSAKQALTALGKSLLSALHFAWTQPLVAAEHCLYSFYFMLFSFAILTISLPLLDLTSNLYLLQGAIWGCIAPLNDPAKATGWQVAHWLYFTVFAVFFFPLLLLTSVLSCLLSPQCVRCIVPRDFLADHNDWSGKIISGFLGSNLNVFLTGLMLYGKRVTRPKAYNLHWCFWPLDFVVWLWHWPAACRSRKRQSQRWCGWWREIKGNREDWHLSNMMHAHMQASTSGVVMEDNASVTEWAGHYKFARLPLEVIFEAAPQVGIQTWLFSKAVRSGQLFTTRRVFILMLSILTSAFNLCKIWYTIYSAGKAVNLTLWQELWELMQLRGSPYVNGSDLSLYVSSTSSLYPTPPPTEQFDVEMLGNTLSRSFSSLRRSDTGEEISVVSAELSQSTAMQNNTMLKAALKATVEKGIKGRACLRLTNARLEAVYGKPQLLLPEVIKGFSSVPVAEVILDSCSINNKQLEQLEKLLTAGKLENVTHCTMINIAWLNDKEKVKARGDILLNILQAPARKCFTCDASVLDDLRFATGAATIANAAASGTSGQSIVGELQLVVQGDKVKSWHKLTLLTGMLQDHKQVQLSLEVNQLNQVDWQPGGKGAVQLQRLTTRQLNLKDIDWIERHLLQEEPQQQLLREEQQQLLLAPQVELELLMDNTSDVRGTSTLPSTAALQHLAKKLAVHSQLQLTILSVTAVAEPPLAEWWVVLDEVLQRSHTLKDIEINLSAATAPSRMRTHSLLVAMTQHCTSLTRLQLSNVPIWHCRADKSALRQLDALVAKLRDQLISLRLPGCDLSDEGAMMLTEQLQQPMPKLEYLDVSNNGMSLHAVVLLLGEAQKIELPTVLGAQQNQTVDRNSPAVQRHAELKVVDVSYNDVQLLAVSCMQVSVYARNPGTTITVYAATCVV